MTNEYSTESIDKLTQVFLSVISLAFSPAYPSTPALKRYVTSINLLTVFMSPGSSDNFDSSKKEEMVFQK